MDVVVEVSVIDSDVGVSVTLVALVAVVEWCDVVLLRVVVVVVPVKEMVLAEVELADMELAEIVLPV